ncbi:MAG: hypothetical protein A3I01_06625 [Betaproteobacteria bacterium RIFCSPLOWO2_02_FULL_65_24]|nr:MAG: hypothetical protein A3I01_06625 [Betaproteobacteria bacterium RIFCSPLOWO2_02_FULL_65_24]
MELRVAVGDYDPATRRYTLYCCADNPVRRKADLAAVLRVPPEQVRVIIRDVGGNFGSRNWFYPEYGIVVWAARRLKRPVKWIATRNEALLSDYQGRDLHAQAQLALDKDGKILALRSSLLGNFGAYSVSYSPLNKTCEILPSVYDIPVAHIRGRSVASNTASTAPYRSSGRPEAMLIIERLLDLAASEHGFDRVELRRRNLVRESAMPYRNPVGLTYDSGAFERSMNRAIELARWQGFPERRAEAKRRGKLRGIGVANYIEVTSGAPRERAEISVLPEGRVEVVIGTSAAGQGHETAFAQCVSEWLGVPFTSVQLITGDTDRVPVGGGSHSARSMRMGGIVMGEASDKVIARATRIAASVLEAAPSDIEFVAGRFTVKGTDRSIGLFDVAREAQSRTTLPEELQGRLAAEHDEVIRVPGFPYGTQVCELEIDPETGTLDIANLVAVDDVGRAINPLILHGQAHGGIAQGVGQALLEHAYYDPETGQMLAGSFMDYAMPRADNFPSFVTEIMEVPTPTNKLGVRGGGEGGTTPALAVVVNAIVDALCEYGVRDFEMPATPERVWRVIREARLAHV